MDNIISIDESSIDSHIQNNRGWSKKGVKVKNIITHGRTRCSLILAVSNKKIIHQKIIKETVNGETFLEFTNELIKKINTKNNSYSLLLDNARIHHYRKLKDFLAEKKNKKINLIYNVPYTPETNPIERVFNDIKRNLKNERIDNANLISKIQKILKIINKNNSFREYFDKSLIDELKKIK